MMLMRPSRHVLCLVVLALCCCAPFSVADTGIPEHRDSFLTEPDGVNLTMTTRFDDNSCTSLSTAATDATNGLIIFTTVTLPKGSSQEVQNIRKSWHEFPVPVGYNLTLDASLVAECTK
ncbi:hypothetical protein DQ04_17431000, partial [Trypanosoma grayi]|uniref:hypothetical protein n=1 Tax=Trypanosoma grayi TaxID=71804 RepID=UPI0004F442EE